MKCLTKHSQEFFLELVRAGLWEKEARLSEFNCIDYSRVLSLAEEQSVVGLVTAGLEQVKDVKVPQEELLQFIGSTLQIEQQNQAMNGFLVKLTKIFMKERVHAILVKGQGVAKCYEKPLWRASGDIDLLLDEKNYEEAKEVLFPIAEHIASEETFAKHQGLNISGFEVELHGRMPFFLSRQVDKVIDKVLADSLKKDGNRIWKLGETDIYLPKPDNDVIIVFTHFLLHFFVEGVGLRQICDWCRLLWTYRYFIDRTLLEKRIRRMGLMTEWKSIASLAVNSLGMPAEAMPFYMTGYENRAGRILTHILECGNMGHNNDLSYRGEYNGFLSGIITLWRRTCDFVKFTLMFPLDAPRFFVNYIIGKV